MLKVTNLGHKGRVDEEGGEGLIVGQAQADSRFGFPRFDGSRFRQGS